MKYLTKITGGTLTAYFDCELDHCSAGKVRDDLDKKITDPSVKRIIFDLSKLNFMDSTGIGLLLGRYKLAKSRGIELFIADPDENVSKILKLSGIFSIISVIDSRGVYGK